MKTDDKQPFAKTQGEIKALTGLRGLAALYVTLYHWVLLDPLFKYETHPLVFSPKTIIVFIGHGFLGVDIFFMLSGFVIAMSSARQFQSTFSTATYRQFLAKRLIRIYPLYCIATIAAFFLLAEVHESSWQTLLGSLFFLQIFGSANYILGPAWSLCTEWFAYLLFPLLLKVVEGRKEKWRPWLVAGGCLATIAVIGVIPYPSNYQEARMSLPANLPFHYNIVNGPVAITRCIIEFTAGIFLFQIHRAGKHFSRFGLPVLTVGCIVLCFHYTDLIFICLIPFIILSISNDSGVLASLLRTKPLYFLGKISYSFYLLHIIFFLRRYDLGEALHWGGVPHYTIVSLFVMIILLLVATISTYQLIEVRLANVLRRRLL